MRSTGLGAAPAFGGANSVGQGRPARAPLIPRGPGPLVEYTRHGQSHRGARCGPDRGSALISRRGKFNTSDKFPRPLSDQGVTFGVSYHRNSP